MSEEDSIQDKSKLWALMIIDSDFDDARLSVAARAVYTHLCRRAHKEHVAWPGITSIAEVCCIARRTVPEAIRELEIRGFIQVHRELGRGSRYEILPKHCWKKKVKIPRAKGTPVSDLHRSKRDTTPVSILHDPHANGTPVPGQMGHPKVSNEGIQEGILSKVSNEKEVLRTSKKTEPDRFATEKDLIQFVLSDTHCRSLKACVIDARWFWNAMIQNGWHRDAKGKNPVRDAKATCRVWMGFEGRPTFKDRNSEQHKERWKTDCQLNLPQEELL